MPVLDHGQRGPSLAAVVPRLVGTSEHKVMALLIGVCGRSIARDRVMASLPARSVGAEVEGAGAVIADTLEGVCNPEAHWVCALWWFYRDCGGDCAGDGQGKSGGDEMHLGIWSG